MRTCFRASLATQRPQVSQVQCAFRMDPWRLAQRPTSSVRLPCWEGTGASNPLQNLLFCAVAGADLGAEVSPFCPSLHVEAARLVLR